jgi:hypothetical protein
VGGLARGQARRLPRRAIGERRHPSAFRRAVVGVQPSLPCCARRRELFRTRRGVAPLSASSDERGCSMRIATTGQPRVSVHFGAKLLQWQCSTSARGYARSRRVEPDRRRQSLYVLSCAQGSTPRSCSISARCNAGDGGDHLSTPDSRRTARPVQDLSQDSWAMAARSRMSSFPATFGTPGHARHVEPSVSGRCSGDSASCSFAGTSRASPSTGWAFGRR